jgi:hypothetical protein
MFDLLFFSLTRTEEHPFYATDVVCQESHEPSENKKRNHDARMFRLDYVTSISNGPYQYDESLSCYAISVTRKTLLVPSKTCLLPRLDSRIARILYRCKNLGI